MGAWDVGSFQSDEALAWVPEFLANPGLDILRDTLDLVVAPGEDEDLKAAACSMAIAAAEVVAALLGKPRMLPDELAEWVLAHAPEHRPDARLIEKAAKVLVRVRTRSELADLWDHPEDAAAWHGELEGLATRLASGSAS